MAAVPFLAAAFALDLLTTFVAFQLGAVEANPLMRDWSFPRIAAAKLAVLAVVLWCLRKPTRMGRVVAWYGAVVTGAVAVWNLAAIMLFVGAGWVIA